jgi:hypothetical protein
MFERSLYFSGNREFSAEEQFAADCLIRQRVPEVENYPRTRAKSPLVHFLSVPRRRTGIGISGEREVSEPGWLFLDQFTPHRPTVPKPLAVFRPSL